MRWTLTEVWWRGYTEGNHGLMGWAVAVSDLVAAGMPSQRFAPDYRSDLLRVAARRWL